MPIKQVLDQEQMSARAILNTQRGDESASLRQERFEEARRTVVLAADDAIRSRAEEARLVRAARSNAVGLLAVTQRMLKAAVTLSEDLEIEMSKANIKPERAIALFQSIASTARSANETAKVSIAMERSLLGQPEKIIGHMHADMTTQEALAEIEMANRAAVRFAEQAEKDVAEVVATGMPELLEAGAETGPESAVAE